MSGMGAVGFNGYKKSIIDSISSQDDRIFLSKVLDQIQLCAKYHEYRYTDFIDPHQQSLIVKKLSNLNDITLYLWGGYDDAERKIACFFPDYMLSDKSQFPITVLKITGYQIEKLSHRDFLGSILGLGIRREKIGDLVMNNNECFCFCSSDIKSYILTDLIKVGSTGVQIFEQGLDEINIPEKKFKIINGTVASLRLDSVISTGLGESRSKILAYIQSEKVNVNWETVKSPSFMVKEGDIISVRGYGRMMLDQVGGITRKGRISIIIKRYI